MINKFTQKCNTLVVLCLLMVGASPVRAQHKDAGTTLFPFLNITYDARAFAMAGASVGMPNGLRGALSNPASLGFEDGMQALLSYRPVFLDVKGGASAFSRDFPIGVCAANLVYLSYGSLDGVDEEGDLTGQVWQEYSVSGTVTWSRQVIENLAVGVNLKGIYDRISGGENHSADGFAVDIGAQGRMYSARFVYGILFRNIGFVRSGYSEETDDGILPFSISTGISYVPKLVRSLRVALDIEKSIDDYLVYESGLEIALYRRNLFARLGYAASHRDITEGLRMLTRTSEGDYQKSNWRTATLGVGIVAPVGTSEVQIDAAMALRTQGVKPTMSVTILLDI